MAIISKSKYSSCIYGLICINKQTNDVSLLLKDKENEQLRAVFF